jgi:hypothetical protein
MAKVELNSRGGQALVGLLAFIAAYIVAIRAINTGSLLQYGLTFALFVFGINRTIKAVRGK